MDQMKEPERWSFGVDPSKAGKDFHIWPEDGNRGGNTGATGEE